jgi:deferrochelatase/peroxidase EfeB
MRFGNIPLEMDANSALIASLNGVTTGAIVYLAGRAGNYRFPTLAAGLAGTAVGIGSYRPRGRPETETETDADSTTEPPGDETADDSSPVDVAVTIAGESLSRTPTRLFSAAVEQATGLGQDRSIPEQPE